MDRGVARSHHGNQMVSVQGIEDIQNRVRDIYKTAYDQSESDP